MKAMKIAAVLLLAVGMFSATAVAQDDCTTAVPAGAPMEPCLDGTPTGPLGSCTSGGGVLDVWNFFVASSTAHRSRTDLASAGSDSDFIVYSGTCGSLTAVPGGCSEDEAPPYLGDICVTGLTPSDTYYIQLGTWADGCPNGPYVVDVVSAGEVCGDGIISCVFGAEQCDDGNTTPGDGCDELCQIEPICGNGVQEPGESCDDGNLIPGDGCDENCRFEPTCGNDVVEAPEQCDDGNLLNGDGCDEFCNFEGAPPIPAVSEWGLLVLVLVGLTVGTVLFGRRRHATA